MTDRIELILKTQNLTPTQFADAIGIQRSSMSHILARRNKPSLDFVMKLLHRFPEINSEWLLTGKNQMFNGGGSAPTLPQRQTPEFEWEGHSGFGADISTGSMTASAPAGSSAEVHTSAALLKQVKPAIDNPTAIESPPNKELHDNKSQNSDIERIIVFFTDGTFRSYV